MQAVECKESASRFQRTVRRYSDSASEDEHHYVCTHLFPRMGRLRSTDEIVAALQATEHVSSNDNK